LRLDPSSKKLNYPNCKIVGMSFASSSALPELSAQERARNIKVLVFDVDGVLTDGQIYVLPDSAGPDARGIEFKGFTAHDGLGISLARLGGLRVGLITKRRSQTVAIRARDLRIEFLYQGQSNKLAAVHEILAATGTTLDQLAYVGDDIIDLPVMRVCGLAIATANARTQAKAVAHYVTPLPGGQGAGRDAIDFILTAQGTLEQVMEQYLDSENPATAAADVGQGSM
jgi:3-deoxy-D-manno-octulosonate 8-phosphate phosphatase (KDO 8-P phosphatase)